MPGYVFFDADTEPTWNRILKDSAVLKLLSYGDGEYALRGTDLEFIDWIKKNNGIIEMSSAVKVGSMIEFVAGPLKDMNGKIIKINRSRRQVQVSFGSENGIISKVWCSMEFVCSNADSYSARPKTKGNLTMRRSTKKARNPKFFAKNGKTVFGAGRNEKR